MFHITRMQKVRNYRTKSGVWTQIRKNCTIRLIYLYEIFSNLEPKVPEECRS